MIIYKSAADFINQRGFEVWVPAFYDPHAREEDINPAPIARQRVTPWGKTEVSPRNLTKHRMMFNPDQKERGLFPIKYMLDMFNRQIEFELANDEDVVEIFEGLDRYLLSIQSLVESGNESVIRYAKQVVAFRQATYVHYFRYMRTHPAALESLYQRRNPGSSLSTILKIIGGSDGVLPEMDPLKALAEPPYSIESKMVKPSSEDVGLGMVESYGISTNTLLAEDDDFNYDNFLKGS